jgi:hypothetical protein
LKRPLLRRQKLTQKAVHNSLTKEEIARKIKERLRDFDNNVSRPGLFKVTILSDFLFLTR